MMLIDPDDDFEALHTAFYPRVYAYILRRINDRPAAEELASDVFRVAWQKNHGRSTVGVGWLLKTARNVIGNEYRGRDRARELQQKLQDGMRAQLQSHPDPERELVAEALGKLASRHQETLMLAYWEDLNTTELAEALGCSASAAGVRLHRARQAISKVLPQVLNCERRA